MDPSAPVQAADPTKPNVFAGLPNELWEEICGHLVGHVSTDFVLAMGAQGDMAESMRPLNPRNNGGDALLHGVPFNGKLYITKVSPCDTCFLGEGYTANPYGANNGIPATDNGPWFSHIHYRVDNGVPSVDRFRTPDAAHHVGFPRHRFFEDADGRVMLHHSDDEVRVNEERHRCDEVRITHASGYGRALHEFRHTVFDRCQQVKNDPRFKYMHLRDASTHAGTGRLTLLAVCKALQLRAKLTILGTLPLMTRIGVFNIDDDISKMKAPYDMTNRMSYSEDKWLVVAPLRWMAMLQATIRGNRHADGTPFYPETEETFVRDFVIHDRTFFCSPQHSIVDLVDELGTHPLCPVHREGKRYPHIPFSCISAAMIYAFFAHPIGILNLTCARDVARLLYRAKTEKLFQNEYSRNGSRYITHVKEGESLKAVTRLGAAAVADDLLGDFEIAF